MLQSVIVVENLSKRYLIGHRHAPPGQYNYVALRDVDRTRVPKLYAKGG